MTGGWWWARKPPSFVASRPASKLLRIHLTEDPSTLDPARTCDLVSACVQSLIFDGLMRLGPTGELEPALAESFEISDDGTRYTFHLRNAYWSTGQKIEAEQFLSSWQKQLRPDFPSVNSFLYYPIRGAEAVKRGADLSMLGVHAPDSCTLVVDLENPCPYFLQLLSFNSFFPEPPPSEGEIACSGPFRLKKWDHMRELLLEKNPIYWGKERIHLDSISLAILPDEHTALELYEQDKLDFLGKPLCSLPLEAAVRYFMKGELHTEDVAAGTICFFNTERFPFTNLKMRQAFSLAINREELVKHVTRLGETSPLSLIPPALRKEGKEPMKLPFYNPVRARMLLAEALAEMDLTMEELPPITYSFSTSHLNKTLAQAIQRQLEGTLGIRVVMEGIEHRLLLARLVKREFSFGQTTWYAHFTDPMSLLERFDGKETPKNYASWESERFRRLLMQIRESLCEEQRAKLIDLAEEELLNAMPFTPLYHWKSAFVCKSHLKNLVQAPIGNVLF